MNEIIIRQYCEDDRQFVRDLAFNTAFMGEPALAFFDDQDILADFLTLYFTDYEPESCFVAESKGRVVGYIFGTRNITILKRVFSIKIFPPLLIKVIRNGAILRKKNVVLFFHFLLSFLKGEFRMPDFSRHYPAHLHINIEKDFRNAGIGSRLVEVYLDYLRDKKIPGVYLATISDKAGDFFKRHGFALLHTGTRSYFNYILHKNTPVYIYGGKLNLHNLVNVE